MVASTTVNPLADPMADPLVDPEPSGTGASSVSAAEGRFHERDQCDREGDQCDREGAQRDRIGQRRDSAAGRRDDTAGRRDHDADQRDDAADDRDRAADERDRAADQRDRTAWESEASLGEPVVTDDSHRAARDRLEAASDRRRAWKDREAGHHERALAEHDRSTALADRVSGAGERTYAGIDRRTALADRRTALADRRASVSLLEHAAVDALTGMYLRGAGLEELERQIARARRTQQPLVVAFIDVDHLKARNDSHGHAAGDRMLVDVARTLSGMLRPYDLIMRYGGDEFVCAVSGLTLADAAHRFGLVNATLAGGPEQKSVTFGLAELQPGDSPQELVARADAALYRQRRQQRGRAEAQVWECGNLVVDEASRTVSTSGFTVAVTESEFDVLRVLIRNHSRVVPHAQLLGQAWGHPVDRHVLTGHLRSLRRKLETHGPRQIHTIRGSGYVLRP